jgi:glycosyltransferase involved in cell wall biosynthesis
MTKQGRPPRVAAVIPVYNERGKIGRAIAKIPRGVVTETIAVSDGSDDGSDEEARGQGASRAGRY